MNGSSPDDTFRKLKQIPYGELKLILRETNILDSGLTPEEVEFWLNHRGWTTDELTNALINELKRVGFDAGDIDSVFKTS